MLEGQPDFDVVGMAEDGSGRLAHEELAPDVTLMDLRMPGLDGVSAIQAIAASSRRPHSRADHLRLRRRHCARH